MTLWMQFEPIRTEAEMRQRHRRNSYLHRPIPRVKDKPPVVKEVVVQLREPKERVREPVDADAHVKSWYAHMRLNDPDINAVAYIRARCAQMDMPYELVVGPCRKRSVGKVRDDLIWEVHLRFPEKSSSQVGQLFGRDHTTILHLYRKRGEKSVQREKIADEKVQEIIRLLASGLSLKAVGRAVGVSSMTVARYRDPNDHSTRRGAYRGTKARAA